MNATAEGRDGDLTRDQPLDVLVIGASQAGLAMAWHLARQNFRLVVVDAAAELGHTWRSRWDSLRLFTPSQYSALPGMAFPMPPDTYPTKDQVADYLRTYAAALDVPVRLNARVSELRRVGDIFEARTNGQVFLARQVVVATGPFQTPYVPAAALRLDDSVTQLHSAEYHNPHALPDGPVLVVGGGNSGLQIAQELASTRRVDVSMSEKPPMLPQRPLGRDLFWWLTRVGLMRVNAGTRIGQRIQARGEFVIGTSRRRLQRTGVTFHPAVADAEGHTVRFADGRSLDVAVVIWATGYRPDYSWLQIPNVVHDGRVNHRRGVTDVPGLYFLGLSWQHTRGSALLGFVGDDAAHLTERLTNHPAAATRRNTDTTSRTSV
jgi:putative flavoprotein involved in K+ transport